MGQFLTSENGNMKLKDLPSGGVSSPALYLEKNIDLGLPLILNPNTFVSSQDWKFPNEFMGGKMFEVIFLVCIDVKGFYEYQFSGNLNFGLGLPTIDLSKHRYSRNNDETLNFLGTSMHFQLPKFRAEGTGFFTTLTITAMSIDEDGFSDLNTQTGVGFSAKIKYREVVL